MKRQGKTKRQITAEEIEDLLSFIVPRRGIPEDTALALVRKHKDMFRASLTGQMIYPSILPKLREKIEAQYFASLIQPGENVGVIAAQSFGQLQTQNTLNSFHQAGCGGKTVLVTGVPRFSEILNATREPKGPSCVIHFRTGNESLQSLKKTIGSSLVYGDFSTFQVGEMMLEKSKTPEAWYDAFAILFNDNFRKAVERHCIVIKFNPRFLVEYNLTLETIAGIISDTYTDLYPVFTPSSQAEMHVYLDMSDVHLPQNLTSFVTEENFVQVYAEEVVIPNIKKLKICGVNGIRNIFYSSAKDGSWYVDTEGTNLSDLLAHDLVDMPKVMTNDMWEICEVLGVEAVRQYLIEELSNIMAGINPCHSKLLVDKMTYGGGLSSISRYSQRSETNGPLSKASFEETSDNLMNAALHGERECTDGVSASIICGKRGKFGTGRIDLMIDVMKLARMNLVDEFVYEG